MNWQIFWKNKKPSGKLHSRHKINPNHKVRNRKITVLLAAIIIPVFLTIGITACSKDTDNKLFTAWTIVDPWSGVREIVFTKDLITIKEFKFGGNPDVEINIEYKIINGIIFTQNYYSFEYTKYADNNNYVPMFFNYAIIDDKLILYGEYTEIYTQKTAKNTENIKSKLNGKWTLREDNKLYEFIFSANALTVNEYNADNDLIIREDVTVFEIDDYYLKLESPSYILYDMHLYDPFLYFFDEDALFLFQTSSGEVYSKMICLNKNK